MQTYELAIILHPDLEIDLDAPLSKVEKLVKEAGGKVIARDDWGKRKLAYAVAKQTYGLYYFYQLEMPSESLKDLEKNLVITDEVLRHLIVKPMVLKKPAEKAKPKKTIAKSTKTDKTKATAKE